MGKNQISLSYLQSLSKEARDRLLEETYGEFSFSDVRSTEDFRSRFFLAAAHLYQNALRSGIPERDAKAQLTSGNITAVASDSWDKPNHIMRAAGGDVTKIFGSMEELRGDVIGWVSSLPEEDDVCTSFFSLEHRVALHGPAGTRNQPSVPRSKFDLLQKTRIPKIDLDTMFLLAVYYGDGAPNDSTNSIHLNGTQHDFPFYEEVVQLLIYSLFNLKTKVSRGLQRSLGVHYPKITVSSEAHHNWLTRLGFPRNRSEIELPFDNLTLGQVYVPDVESNGRALWGFEGYTLPELAEFLLIGERRDVKREPQYKALAETFRYFTGRMLALKKAFFAGIIASMGVIGKGSERRTLRLPETNERFVLDLKKLAREAGYNPSERTGRDGLFFTRDETVRMIYGDLGFTVDYLGAARKQTGLYTNPKHLERIKMMRTF